jgi:hypothetical protein
LARTGRVRRSARTMRGSASIHFSNLQFLQRGRGRRSARPARASASINSPNKSLPHFPSVLYVLSDLFPSVPTLLPKKEKGSSQQRSRLIHDRSDFSPFESARSRVSPARAHTLTAQPIFENPPSSPSASNPVTPPAARGFRNQPLAKPIC